jgi:hypothetical protein
VTGPRRQRRGTRPRIGVSRVARHALALATSVGAIGAVPGATASAEPPEHPHGVGVCISQLAVGPDLVGIDHLGELAVGGAGPGSPGSDVPSGLADVRGDGPGGCGAPPGPGHLR